MQPRIPALCLSLLVVLSVTAASAAASDVSLTEGESQLYLSTDRVSALPLDIEALAENLCPSKLKPIYAGGASTCKLKISASGPSPTAKPSLSLWLPTPGSESLAWYATSFDAAGPFVETSCGVWQVSIRLEPTDPQKSCPLLLHPDVDDANHGLLASVVKVKAHLQLTNLDTQQTLDYTLLIGLDMAGSWSKDAKGYLLVFPDGQCVPATILEAPGFLNPYKGDECEICFGSSDSP